MNNKKSKKKIEDDKILDLLKLDEVKSERLINTLNSIYELGGIYFEPSVIVMCLLCKEEKKKMCRQKFLDQFGRVLPFQIIKCSYEEIKNKKIQPSQKLMDLFLITLLILKFYSKYEEIPDIIFEMPCAYYINKEKGEILYESASYIYRKSLIEILYNIRI